MSILKFMTQDELDSLSDNPRLAFMEMLNFAQRSLDSQLSRHDPDDAYGREARDDLRYSFMNVVVAAAKNLGIEPFKSMDVPRYVDWSKSGSFYQFQSDVDHYLTQLILDNKHENRKDSVELTLSTKEQIRTQIHDLRKFLETAEIDEPKREALLARLDDLEKELEKRRTSMLSVAKVAFAVLAIPGSMWATADVAQKLVSTIMTSVAEAQSRDEHRGFFGPPPSLRELSPPREENATPRFGSHSGSFGRSSPRPSQENLDDDIPF